MKRATCIAVVALCFLLLSQVHISVLSQLAASDPSRFRIYDLPSNIVPCDICVGPDGAIWGDDLKGLHFFRLDPDTGHVDIYDIPFAVERNFTLPEDLSELAGKIAFPCAVASGADGKVYTTTGLLGGIASISPETRKAKMVTPLNPLSNLIPFNALYSSADGMYFGATTANTISFFSYETQRITSVYSIPTAASWVQGIYVASDGMVYFAEMLANKIGMLDPRSKTIKEFLCPSECGGPASCRVETPTGKKHPYIWFTAIFSNSNCRLDPNTGSFRVYIHPLPGGLPSANTIDKEMRVWYTLITQNALGVINSKNGNVSYVTVPGTEVVAPISVPPYVLFSVVYGPGNALFFNEVAKGKISRYSLE